MSYNFTPKVVVKGLRTDIDKCLEQYKGQPDCDAVRQLVDSVQDVERMREIAGIVKDDKLTLKGKRDKIDDVVYGGTIKTQVLQLLAMPGDAAQKRTYRQQAQEKIAQTFKQYTPIYVTEVDQSPEFWAYHEGIYVPNGRAKIESYVRTILGEVYTQQFANAVIDRVRVDSYIDAREFFDEKEDSELLPVANGILDLRTRELKPFSPDYRFFSKLNVAYDPEAKCPEIEKFIGQIVKPEDIQVVQQMLGWTLRRNYVPQRFVMLHGWGRNGKGALLKLWEALLGYDNCAHVGLEQLQKDMYAAGELHRKLANFAGDLGNQMIQDTELFLKVTGKDRIDVARKFLNRLKFMNYAKLVTACNEIPRVNTDTAGWWNRVLLVTFPHCFLSEKELKSLPREDGKIVLVNGKRVDPADVRPKIDDVEQQLMDELPGLLNWAMDGLDYLRDHGDFATSQSAIDVRRTWKRRSSSLEAFCEDCVVTDYDSYITKEEFRQRYNSYCREQGEKPEGDIRIRNYLTKELGVSESKKRDGEDRIRVWQGISFKTQSTGTGGTGGTGVSTSPIEHESLTYGGKNHKTPVPLDEKQNSVACPTLKKAWDLAEQQHGKVVGKPILLSICEDLGIVNADSLLSKQLKNGEAFEPRSGMVSRT